MVFFNLHMYLSYPITLTSTLSHLTPWFPQIDINLCPRLTLTRFDIQFAHLDPQFPNLDPQFLTLTLSSSPSHLDPTESFTLILSVPLPSPSCTVTP